MDNHTLNIYDKTYEFTTKNIIYFPRYLYKYINKLKEKVKIEAGGWNSSLHSLV